MSEVKYKREHSMESVAKDPAITTRRRLNTYQCEAIAAIEDKYELLFSSKR